MPTPQGTQPAHPLRHWGRLPVVLLLPVLVVLAVAERSEASEPVPAAAPAPVASDRVDVILTDPLQVTQVEVVCPSGFRQRSALAGGRATIINVPPKEECRMHFLGSTRGWYGPMGGGHQYTCTIPDPPPKDVRPMDVKADCSDG